MIKGEFDMMMAAIAQGVINITEGSMDVPVEQEGCFIGNRSRVHVAMEQLCEVVNNGEVGLLKK